MGLKIFRTKHSPGGVLRSKGFKSHRIPHTVPKKMIFGNQNKMFAFSHLESIWIILEGGLASCAHTNR
jgi:hypothetical protein